MTTRAYKQGDRLILVIENCTGDAAVRVNQFLAHLLAENATETDVPGLEPVRNVEEPVPELCAATPIRSKGEFFREREPATTEDVALKTPVEGGLTLRGAMEKSDRRAIVKLWTSNGDPTVKRMCADWLLADLGQRDPLAANTPEVMRFCIDYGAIITPTMQQRISEAGFADGKTFFKEASPAEQSETYFCGIRKAVQILSH